MKTSIKFMAPLMVAMLGFYNLKVTKAHSNPNFSIEQNFASADSEAGAGKHNERTYASGLTTISTIRPGDGAFCTRTCKFEEVICKGSGTLFCEPFFRLTDCGALICG